MYISTMKGALHADHPQSRCRRSAAAYGHLSHGAGIYAANRKSHRVGRSYPSPELIRSDIAQGICRVLSDEAGIHGVFALLDTPEPTYSRIEGAWRNDAPYLTIHRLAGDGRTHGLFRCAADYCKAISRNVRADTHADNRTMQHLLEENGFLPCGTIHVRDGTPRLAYQWTADRP